MAEQVSSPRLKKRGSWLVRRKGSAIERKDPDLDPRKLQANANGGSQARNVQRSSSSPMMSRTLGRSFGKGLKEKKEDQKSTFVDPASLFAPLPSSGQPESAQKKSGMGSMAAAFE